MHTHTHIYTCVELVLLLTHCSFVEGNLQQQESIQSTLYYYHVSFLGIFFILLILRKHTNVCLDHEVHIIMNKFTKNCNSISKIKIITISYQKLFNTTFTFT